MFNVHKVTFRYIRILPNLTIQQTIIFISFNIVTKLFGVWVVKLWLFKNGINVSEATFCTQNLLCGNMSRNFKIVPFCSL